MTTRIVIGAILGGMLIPTYGLIYHFFGPAGAEIFSMSVLFAAAGALIAFVMT